MTLLPVVERELRVAARKRSTFWTRIAAALVAFVIGVGFFIFIGGNYGRGGLGKEMFAVLTWLALGVALSAGLFLTSDCLSEEKREGTLGFLFLTDLRSYDVVLGKLLATSLRGFFALFAILPILATTLLMGGVTGAEFWKTSIALLNAMMISLVAGLFVSCLSKDSQRALSLTLLVLILLVAIGPVASANFRGVPLVSDLKLSSPGYLFVSAGAWGRNPFWQALLINQAIACVLLVLSCALLPRRWQDTRTKIGTGQPSWARWFKFGGAKRRAKLRRALLGINPVMWLACRERWQAFSLWVVAVLMAGGVAAVWAGAPRSTWWFAWNYLSGALTLVVYLGIASQASRFLVEAHRSGLTELLLATPLTVAQIVQGQWRAVLRMFAIPLLICLGAQFIGTFNQQLAWTRVSAPPTPVRTAGMTNSSSMVSSTSVTRNASPRTRSTTTTTYAVKSFQAPMRPLIIFTSIGGLLTTLANVTALMWFGMWMGLTSKSTNIAILKGMVFVQVVPFFCVSFLAAMAIPLLAFSRLAGAAPGMMFWYPLIFSGISTALYLGKDAGFSLWARNKLYSQFRERAAGILQPVHVPMPPPLPGQGHRPSFQQTDF